MTVQSPRNLAYEATRSWLASEPGRAGLVRLEALGASWGRTAKPHRIVESLSQMEDAPPLPKLPSFRDKANFLCGAAWSLALIGRKANR